MRKTLLFRKSLLLSTLFLLPAIGFAQFTQEWVARHNGPGNDLDETHAVAVDASGNVYVTGASTGTGTGLDYSTIKYNAAGEKKWEARYNGPGNGRDEALSMAVDPKGNVFVTGGSIGTGIGAEADFATIKYNTDGVLQWVARYNGPGNGDDQANSIAVDNDGNVYITGFGVGDGTFYDFATIKYNKNGIEQWVGGQV